MADQRHMSDMRTNTQVNINNARNAPDETPRVAALGDLGDFQVAEGYPDPRGWDAMDAGGKKVGKVHDLIVDTGQMRTRYLDIKLDKDAIGADDDRHVLMPIGAAKLDDNDDNVMLGSMTAAQIAALPRFEHGEITRSYEDSVLAGMGGGTGPTALGAAAGGAAPSGAVAAGAAAGGADYYDTHHFDDKRFFSSRNKEMKEKENAGNANEARITRSEEELDIGKRQVQGGEVNVHKRIETEHVKQPVTLQHEEVTIERRPVRAGEAGKTIGADEEIRIPITAEEAVVQKRAVAKEELVIKKHMVSEDKSVEADLRKEKIDIDRSHEHDVSGHDNSST